MYKLVAIDLDGTMLNSKGIVTDKVKKSIKKAISKGIEVVIASGRNISSIRTIAEEAGIHKYCISGNGAAIYDLRSDERLYEKYISKEEILKAMQILEENDIYYTLYTDEILLTKSLNYTTLSYYSNNLRLKDEKRTRIAIVKDLIEYVQEENEKYIKIMLCEKEEEKFKNVVNKLKQIESLTTLEMGHTYKKIILQDKVERNIDYYYAEILNNESDKWYAIEYLINKLNIKKEEIAAIGDNSNDFKMIENAGLGISLKGSNPGALEKADVIVSDNNSDGVAEAIEKYVI